MYLRLSSCEYNKIQHRVYNDSRSAFPSYMNRAQYIFVSCFSARKEQFRFKHLDSVDYLRLCYIRTNFSVDKIGYAFILINTLDMTADPRLYCQKLTTCISIVQLRLLSSFSHKHIMWTAAAPNERESRVNNHSFSIWTLSVYCRKRR